MRSRPFLLLATGFGLLTIYSPGVVAKPKVAVLGLEVTGDSASDAKATEAAKVLTRELRREADQSDGPLDLAPNSGKDLLEMKLLGDCSDEGRRCMSEIGKQLRAQRLIYGKLERTRRGFAVELRLLDTENAELIKEVDEIIPSSDASATGGLQRHARALYGKLTGAGEEGALAISANAERGTVYVDGEVRTSLSAGSARVSGLTEGVHSVAIEAPGFERFETEVSVEAGESHNVRAKLKALEDVGGGSVPAGEQDAGTRPGRGWRIAVWGGVIAAAGAGAGWAYSGVTVRSEEDNIRTQTVDYAAYEPTEGQEDSLVTADDEDDNMQPIIKDSCKSFKGGETAANDPRSKMVSSILDSCDRAKRNRTLVNLVWIPATAAAVVFTGFAIYKGYIAPGKMTRSEREAARRRGSKPQVMVAPMIGPSVLGAGLELQF